MTLPASPDPTSETQDFGRFRASDFLPALLLGWGLGALLVFAVRGLGDALLSGPCQGRTLVALSMPLLLGPGGLGLLALNSRRPRRAALSLGLVLASLLPGLFVGALDIGKLRTGGCAGGYVVIAQPGSRAKSVGTISLRGGETQRLTARIGGYDRTQHPGPFRLSASSSDPSITLTLDQPQAEVGQTFGLSVSAAPGAAINTFQAGVQAEQVLGGQKYAASGALEVDIRP